jgi:hypothetical protein
MGQKVNPIISRLGEITYWKQQYFEKKSNEIATYSLKSLEIKKFIYKFFKDNGLIVQNCKLHYINENSLHLYISYYITLESLFLITKINKQQNIKFIRSKKKLKKKKYLILKKNIKNYLNYQKIKYNRDLNNDIKKKHKKHVKTVLHAEQKMLKIRRMILLTFYKQNIRIKNYNNAIRIKYNSFLEKLFKSLQLFINNRDKK